MSAVVEPPRAEMASTPRPLASPRAQWRSVPLLAGLGFTAVMAVVTSGIVAIYYQTHLPHFDSVANYLIAYNVINAVQHDGLWQAWLIMRSTSITWLQPWYALALAWLPARSPEWLVPLNFLLMALTQLCIYGWCRDQGYGPLQTVVVLVLPYVPGEFYVWDGGLPDWRRDGQLNVLLIGVFFLSLAYVTRPTRKKGLALGLMLGLTQWSRDNALSMIALVAAPAAIIALLQAARSRRWLALLDLAWLPLLAFLLLALPYYWYTLELTVNRYLYAVWGPGEDRWLSLKQFWASPWHVLLGGTTAYNGKLWAGRTTLAFIGAIGGLLAALWATGIVSAQPRRLLQWRARVLLLSGAFVVVAVILYTTLGLGYGAQYHGMPFMPVLVGLVGIFAGASDAFSVRARWLGSRLVSGAVALALGVLLLANVGRMLANRFDPAGTQVVSDVRSASVRLQEIAGNRVIAVLWLNDFSRAHIAYYLAQSDRPPMRLTGGEASDRPSPPAEDPAMLAEYEAMLRKDASVVVVATDTARYTNPRHDFALFRAGTQTVERLLHDPSFQEVERFSIGPVPFVVLVNREVP